MIDLFFMFAGLGQPCLQPMHLILKQWLMEYLFDWYRLTDNMKKYPSDLQKMYYTLLVLWLISFSDKSIPFFTNPGVLDSYYTFIELTN